LRSFSKRTRSSALCALCVFVVSINSWNRDPNIGVFQKTWLLS
jgi:hypothetical protein